MSHFRDDKDGSPADPTQKTLSSFIVPGDANGNNMDDHISFVSDVSASILEVNKETGLPIDNHELCSDLRDQSDSNQILEHNRCTLSDNSEEMEKSCRPLRNESKDEVCTRPNFGVLKDFIFYTCFSIFSINFLN